MSVFSSGSSLLGDAGSCGSYWELLGAVAEEASVAVRETLPLSTEKHPLIMWKRPSLKKNRLKTTDFKAALFGDSCPSRLVGLGAVVPVGCCPHCLIKKPHRRWTRLNTD